MLALRLATAAGWANQLRDPRDGPHHRRSAGGSAFGALPRGGVAGAEPPQFGAAADRDERRGDDAASKQPPPADTALTDVDGGHLVVGEYRKGKLRRGGVAGPQSDAQTRRARRRGELALVAVQFVAESTLKVLLGVPVVGGIFLVVLLLGANADELLAGDLREIVAQVFAAMRQNVPALVAFSIAFTVVLLGGSALTFVIKAARCRCSPPRRHRPACLERPPVSVRACGAPTLSRSVFLDGCQRQAPIREAGRLPAGHLRATAALYLAFVIGGYHLVGNAGVLLGWTIATATASSVLIVWITLVNFFYLLTQMVVAIEDISVRNGVRRAVHFVRSTFREIAGIFGVVLLLAVIATIASIVADRGSADQPDPDPGSPCCRCRSRPGWCAASSFNTWRWRRSART